MSCSINAFHELIIHFCKQSCRMKHDVSLTLASKYQQLQGSLHVGVLLVPYILIITLIRILQFLFIVLHGFIIYFLLSTIKHQSCSVKIMSINFLFLQLNSHILEKFQLLRNVKSNKHSILQITSPNAMSFMCLNHNAWYLFFRHHTCKKVRPFDDIRLAFTVNTV